MSDPMAEIRASFFIECEELLESLQDGLQMMDDGDTDSETINIVFRAVHSIKGGAGAFGLDDLVHFAHRFETAMDEVRAGRFHPDGEAIRLFFTCADILGDLVRAARDEGEVPSDVTDPVLAKLEKLVGVEEEEEEDLDFTPATLSLDLGGLGGDLPDLGGDLPDLSALPATGAEDDDALPLMADSAELTAAAPIGTEPLDIGAPEAVVAKGFTVFFKPEDTLYASGNEPLYLFRALRDLGDISVVAHCGDLPALDTLDPDTGHLSWTVTVHTEEPELAVREVFEFVDGLCQLDITPLKETGAPIAEAPAVTAAAEAPAPLPPLDFAADLPSDLSSAPTAELPPLTPAPTAPATPELAPAPLPETPMAAELQPMPEAAAAVPQPAPKAAAKAEEKPVVKPVAKSEDEPGKPAASSAPAKATGTPTQPRATVRVDLERIDRLVNLVGELVINQAMLSQSVTEAGLPPNSPVSTGLEEFLQLTRDIQESVMMIRAQPIKSLFQRMGRIVRESSASVGKEVRLHTDGENTEVDKTVIERLADPLTHMIRNAVDHGLESPEKRLEAGKSREGHVTLTAQHRSGRIVIEVSDDGAGINRERVKAKAIENGLIPADAQLSDSDIDNLLFLPGFSTAAEISNLSGRGVGMDVVKSSIQALGGRISITSQEGKGTTFSISLPLTLAVLDGMVVRVDDETLVVPLNAILETLTLTDNDLKALGPETHVVQIRGGFVPLLDLGAELGYRQPLDSYVGGIVLLIGQEDGNRAALVVDAIEDQRQVVIKGLEGSYGRVPGIAAATILGDGQIALILDPTDLVGQASGRTRTRQPQPALVG
ncbi:chemotaxis protein CheA [Celeribacter neptunius]|uniref:Chemotaxis protein CheA n=1 Tax=Celeribacter neptunius TaxID=588602 RepID=A0A1I3LRD1_9RHOB|nr:chemotaxis protein CheA [Celeribacter neptunius]SFI87291.1 two-component system, chemotaxis family, sensor kinase CheA [Celeribacter neptunius]